MPRAKNMNPETPNNMNEHFVTYEQATALSALGFDIYGEYCYCTEMFCSGNNPMVFDTYSVGQRCFWHEVYSVDKNGEEQERGIPCPTLAQAAAWLRRNGWHVQPMLNGVRSMYFVRVLETVGNGEVIEGERQFDEYEDALSHGIDLAIKRMTR